MALYVDVEKSFPDFKLSVQLESEDEVVALLGSSGCGKSLTLKCIAGIEKPDKGRIVINDEVVFDSTARVNLPPQRRRVGYLFQNYALFPTMTVWNNIASVAKNPRSEKHILVDNIIKKFGLEGVKKLYPRQISGGQQQRTALARILVSQPKILMLDEPFSALDTHLKWRMEQEVAAVLAEFDGTTVFVSHNRDEVYRLCDRIAVMNEGKIETIGAKTEIFDIPKTLTAAMMTGCKNISQAEKSGEYRVVATNWGIEFTTTRPVPNGVKYVGVRAHHFQRTHEIEGRENVFSCHVHKVIDEPFERVFVISFGESMEKLQFEVSKDICEQWGDEEFALYISPDKIYCLE